jgi:hypothetical protein
VDLGATFDRFFLVPARGICDIILDYTAYCIVSCTVSPFSQFHFANLSLTGTVLGARPTSSTSPEEATLLSSSDLNSLNPSELLSSIFYNTTYNLPASLSALFRVDYYVTLSDMSSLFGYYFTNLETLLAGRGLAISSSASAIDATGAQPFTTRSLEVTTVSSNHELMGDVRFQKAANPVFKYDFKVGNYLPDSVKTLNQHLFTTFNDVTGGIRKAP